MSGPGALRFYVGLDEVRPLVAVGAVDGLAVTLASGANGIGAGRLKSIAGLARWRAPGSATWGAAVDVSAGGEFVLVDGEDSGAFVRVTSTAARLPEDTAEALVMLTLPWGRVIDDVPAEDAVSGAVDTVELSVANEGDDPALGVTVTVDDDGAANGIEVSADGVTFGSSAYLGTIAASDSAALHIRRTTTAGADSDPSVLAGIEVNFKV